MFPICQFVKDTIADTLNELELNLISATSGKMNICSWLLHMCQKICMFATEGHVYSRRNEINAIGHYTLIDWEKLWENCRKEEGVCCHML